MTITIEVDADLHAAIATCIAERNEGMTLAEEADRSGWNKALIDQAIDALASTGTPFSSNDLRVLLPDDVPGPLFGARFHHAANNRGVIRYAGQIASTKRNTHNKPVGLWIGTAQPS